jgi:hypothetical protein
MTCIDPPPRSANVAVYGADVSASRPVTDYTPRVFPYCGEASVPLELHFHSLARQTGVEDHRN